jgi:hypothetical protein
VEFRSRCSALITVATVGGASFVPVSAGDPVCATLLLAAEEHPVSAAVDLPKVAIAADIDADCDQDVVVASFADDTVAWFESDGGAPPVFTKHVITATANGATALAVADVDGDRDLDVVWGAWFDGTVVWHENDGGASPMFTPHVVDTGVLGVEGVAAGDVDGDGHVDLVSALGLQNTVAWYESDGGSPPAFTKHVIDAAAAGAHDVIVVDLNDDTVMDVIGASKNDDTVAWYDGAAAFTKRTIITTADGVRDVHATDLDGDGDLDVLSASVSDDTVAWHENDGAAVPTFKTHVISTATEGAGGVTSVDLDGDGDLDVIVASIVAGTVDWFANDGGTPPTFSRNAITDDALGAEDVDVADLDGDLDPDVLAASNDDDTVRWFAMGTPIFGACCLDDGTCVEDMCLSDCATVAGWEWNASATCMDVTCPGGDAPAQFLVEELDPQRFKDNIQHLADYGTRYWDRPQNQQATEWLADQLEQYGYDNVTLHPYLYQGVRKFNVYATKVGLTDPDHMYIVSAHFDTFNKLDQFDNAPGADDDASGTSSVLEMARVFARADTDISIRFVLWNNEETGLNGSKAYVESREALQGTPEEPHWLGVIQQDMIMYDHGPGPVPDADVEYQQAEWDDGRSAILASFVAGAMQRYGDGTFPAEVGSDMDHTDSVPFMDSTTSISVRENMRNAEIGTGSNPHWHHATDLPETYTDADYALGFNIVRMITGALGELTNARPRACPYDIDGNGSVDFVDLLSVLSKWGTLGGPEDLDGSGVVDFGDLLLVLSGWGSCR